MSSANQPPDPARLQRLVLGQVPESEADPLEPELLQGDEGRLQQLDLLRSDDPLVHAVRQVAAANNQIQVDTLVTNLTEKLRQLPMPLQANAAADPDTPTAALEATLSPEVPPAPPAPGSVDAPPPYVPPTS